MLLGLVMLASSAAIVDSAPGGRSPVRYIPRCAEDAVLIGAGAFVNGRWSRYRCGPAVDDYSEGGWHR